MNKPRVCVTIVEKNLAAIKEVEPDVDLFEIRMDLIGPDWQELVTYLNKPWIACNRCPEEGGKASADQVRRVEELLWAAEKGATIIDIEHRTQGLADIVPLIKARAKCLVSFHDIVATPAYETLVGIAESQLQVGADYCKIVTTAQAFADNLTVLKLVSKYPADRMIAFAMGEAGRLSRIMSPLAGAYLTYACMAAGKESASGQIPIRELKEIYSYLK
jgi:3-dehydroquinate dehydratase-1